MLMASAFRLALKVRAFSSLESKPWLGVAAIALERGIPALRGMVASRREIRAHAFQRRVAIRISVPRSARRRFRVRLVAYMA
jgi:hypothetical protein